MPENNEKVCVIQMISTRYEWLIKNKEYYDTIILSQLEERELRKENPFQISSLNIKILKFKGYESALDIYSFQYDFEKLYLNSTPKKMLPDPLNNNYLEGPALTLVWRLDNIEEIWSRL